MRLLPLSVMHEFMRRYPFATIISSRDGIHVSHFNGATGTTCVFHGPHACISPTWYTQRPAVPTWNYAVVHAIGTATVIDETLGTFEPALRDPAADGHLPEAYRAKLLKGIRAALQGQGGSVSELLELMRRPRTP